MQTVIFCGGRSTRLGSGGAMKKELVEIGGRPILWHVMKIYAAYGYHDFVLPLGHRGDMIRRYFFEYERMYRDLSFRLGDPDRITFHGPNHEGDWRVTLVDTGLEASKGERLRRVVPYLTGERFFLTYGDGVGDVDVAALLRFHMAHGRLATVTGYRPAYQYGVVEATPEGCVTAYRQYPRLDHWINAGFMVFERAALDLLEAGMELEREFFDRLVTEGQFMLYRHTGFWRSLDTFKDARALNELWERGNAPWKVW